MSQIVLCFTNIYMLPQLNPAIAYFKELVKIMLYIEVFIIAKTLQKCFLEPKFVCSIGGIMLKAGAL